MDRKDYIKSLKITGITLIGLSIFWALFSIQTSFGYSGTGTIHDLKSGSIFNGDLLAQPLSGSVTIYFGTQSTSPAGTGTVGYIGTSTAGLPKIKYSYTGGSSTITFDGFTHVAINGSDIPLSGSLSTKLDSTGGVGTNNTFNNPTLAGQGTITATFNASGLDITPAELSMIDGATISLNKATGSITSHTHTGSDGTTQIPHNNITGTGTNSHSTIDTFIASKAQASGLASLDGSSLVVQNPTSATNSPTASKIPIALGTGKLDDSWLSNNITKLGTPTTDNISEGNTNKYYTDVRVNAAVGSLSVNALSDVIIISPANGQFLKYTGSEWINGTSSASVAFSEVTGSASASQLPLISGMLGSATSAQLPSNPTFVGTLTSSIAIFGTNTQRNASIMTIHGTATSPLSIVANTVLGTHTTALMTSNTAPAPNIVSASAETVNYEAYKAFDRSALSDFSTPAGFPQWIKYNFGSTTTRAMKNCRITVTLGASNPKDFAYQVSSDDTTWVTIRSIVGETSWVTGVANIYVVATSTVAYQFHRIYITAITGADDHPQIAEINFIERDRGADAVYVDSNGTLILGTITPSSSSTSYKLQIDGSGLAASWGVTCYGSIKSIIGSGSDIIKEGYEAVIGTKLFKHHPKIRDDITLIHAEEIAKSEYTASFTKVDYETFKADRLGSYTSYDVNGSSTVDWTRFNDDFQMQYVKPREDEFSALPDKNKRVKNKKVELESDTSITSISPVSDDPSTPAIFKRSDPKILDLENQIGALMGAVQYQKAEIRDLKNRMGIP